MKLTENYHTEDFEKFLKLFNLIEFDSILFKVLKIFKNFEQIESN